MPEDRNRIDVFKDRSGAWRWTVYDVDGEIVGVLAEAYKPSQPSEVTPCPPP